LRLARNSGILVRKIAVDFPHKSAAKKKYNVQRHETEDHGSAGK